MANKVGDEFVSKGIKYVLDNGPKGNLRPYKVGPVGGGGFWPIATHPAVLVGVGILAVAAIAWWAISDNEQDG